RALVFGSVVDDAGQLGEEIRTIRNRLEPQRAREGSRTADDPRLLRQKTLGVRRGRIGRNRAQRRYQQTIHRHHYPRSDSALKRRCLRYPIRTDYLLPFRRQATPSPPPTISVPISA